MLLFLFCMFVFYFLYSVLCIVFPFVYKYLLFFLEVHRLLPPGGNKILVSIYRIEFWTGSSKFVILRLYNFLYFKNRNSHPHIDPQYDVFTMDSEINRELLIQLLDYTSFISILTYKLIIQPVYRWRCFLCEAKDQHWLGRLIVEVSVSHTITNTHPAELLRMSDQHLTVATTYTKHDKRKGITYIYSRDLNPPSQKFSVCKTTP